MITALAAWAAPRGVGPLLIAPGVLAGELSIGWSNDYFDARGDAAAGRRDKPVAVGAISARSVFVAAWAALAVSVALCFAIASMTGAVNLAMMAAGWAYNAGLKATVLSGPLYAVGFGLIPAFAASTLPGHPAPRPWLLGVAALLGLGGHFANSLPDLAGDLATGVRGLPQRVAERGGPGAVRYTALFLLTGASALLAFDPSAARRWPAVAGLAVAVLLGLVAARASGRVPFLAAIAIAAIDIALFPVGGVALT
jgi:4-hydroxybenzoate polyprenyltransferase